MKINVCPRCGKQLNQGDQMCLYCGRIIPVARKTNTNTSGKDIRTDLPPIQSVPNTPRYQPEPIRERAPVSIPETVTMTNQPNRPMQQQATPPSTYQQPVDYPKDQSSVWGKFGCLIMIILTVLVAVIWGNVSSCQEREETQKQLSIITDVSPLIEGCKSIKDSRAISLRGKALVWDISSGKISGAYNLLPQELRAKSSDKLITVFMVLGARSELVGTYVISKQPGYREYMDVCVAYWPERKAAGSYSIVSKDPPSSRTVQQVPEHGDPNVPIADWIKSLPRNPQ